MTGGDVTLTVPGVVIPAGDRAATDRAWAAIGRARVLGAEVACEVSIDVDEHTFTVRAVGTLDQIKPLTGWLAEQEPSPVASQSVRCQCGRIPGVPCSGEATSGGLCEMCAAMPAMGGQCVTVNMVGGPVQGTFHTQPWPVRAAPSPSDEEIRAFLERHPRMFREFAHREQRRDPEWWRGMARRDARIHGEAWQ